MTGSTLIEVQLLNLGYTHTIKESQRLFFNYVPFEKETSESKIQQLQKNMSLASITRGAASLCKKHCVLILERHTRNNRMKVKKAKTE